MKMTKPISPPKNDPEHWAWHREKLEYLRDRLLEDSDTQRSNASETPGSHTSDFADSATDESDHDMALSLLVHDQNALREVTAAIRRIQQGLYGICEETGKPIPAARLRAVPWTRYTREVEERLEREGIVELSPPGRPSSHPGTASNPESPP